MAKKIGGLVVVTFKVEPELLTQLDLYAINKRMSRSEAIREALKLLLGKQNGNSMS